MGRISGTSWVRGLLFALCAGSFATLAVAQGSGRGAAVVARKVGASGNDLRYLCQSSCGSIRNDDTRYLCQGSCGSIRDNDARYYCQSSCGSIRDDDLRYFCQGSCGSI